ncbi:MAG: nucleotidyltransferase domain-containing protein [Candidatus Bathyarchaeia archaeon]
MDAFAVYGSVARGDARFDSDVDVLIISEDLTGSLGSRIRKLYTIEEALQDELRWLRRHKVYTGLSFYPLREG